MIAIHWQQQHIIEKEMIESLEAACFFAHVQGFGHLSLPYVSQTYYIIGSSASWPEFQI